MDDFYHVSVLADEVMQFLAPVSGGVYVDGTLGGAGHGGRILEATAPDGILVGIDRDPAAIRAAKERLAPFGDRARIVHGSFGDLVQHLDNLGIESIDGLLLDLGVSSHQLDAPERGFSFQADAPLDMRMDTTAGVTAADLVNSLSHGELARVIREYGEERWAGRIASFICTAREEDSAWTTVRLAELVKGAIPRKAWEERIHPATRTFQALRIAVNRELEQLEAGLAAGIGMLRPGGRVAVISFHSLEDRIVKNSFRAHASGCVCPKGLPVCQCGKLPELKILTGRPVTATAEELAANPRSRSAKLRAAEKQ